MSADGLESAMDSDDPEEALTVFLLEKHAAAAELQAGEASLSSELQGLGLKALRKRAKDMGVTAEQLEDAMDEDEAKDAVIALILAVRTSTDDQVEDSATAALRQELSGLKLKALKSRARELGVSEEALADADDADDGDAGVVLLCIETGTLDEDTYPWEATLRAELAPLKLKALKSRARAVGVSDETLDDADDTDNVKKAVTDLIIASQAAALQAVPQLDEPQEGEPCATTACASIAELTAAIVSAQLPGVEPELLKLEVWDETFTEWLSPDAIDDIEPKSVVRLQLLKPGGEVDSHASGAPQRCSVLVQVDAALKAKVAATTARE